MNLSKGTMQLIDTHVHINFKALASDLDAIRQRWQEAGVVRLVHSCVHPGEFQEIQEIANQVPELSFAVGLHPLDAKLWDSTSAQTITQLAQSDDRVVAIGEMGLDFYKADNRDQQIQVFTEQLEIAYRLHKPVIIHCREAAETMIPLLRQFWQERGKVSGVMHCWGGTPDEQQEFLKLGLYISFSGTVTFKNAIAIHECARLVPSDRILIETDCPFLAPVPQRGKRNEPAFVRHVAETVARLRDISLETLSQQTTDNACQLFQLSVIS
ncbi:putative enzyme [Planktothrix paucivesiculata PCC 9631]|uniref:D-aminoacyl-tRNA deacylase n=2 Tax=Planktothrix TaxID=54304 RepID=A0A7Z9BNS2_9CYAN|nr:putative enzyme [Planktothrix paucivesiculata PCC 9631]